MGRGAKTSQTGVKRHKPAYSSDAVAVGGGSGPAPEMAEGCLFSFTEQVELNGASSMSATSALQITMLPSATKSELLVTADNGARLGVYAGDHVTQMLRCMRKKYVYRGVIDSVVGASGKSRTVILSVQGMGLL